MKDKILVIIFGMIFVLSLIWINNMLNKQENTKPNVKQTENNNESGEENMNVLEVTSENFEEVLKSDKPVLIDFYAEWCGPCKMLSPIVEQVANENDNIKVCKVNVDNAQDLAIQYGVMSIPTVVVIKAGEEVNRAVGVVSKSEILDMVK